MRRRSDAPLVVLDVLVALLVSVLAFWLRFEDVAVPERFVDAYRAAAVATAVLWVLLARASGLYSRAALRPGSSNLEAAFAAATATGALLLMINYIALRGDVSRAWIGLVVLGLLLGGMASRGALRRSRRALVPLGVALERYAVVGCDAPSRRLVADLTRAPGTPFKVVATLPAELPPDELVSRVHALRLDGLILPPGATADAARLAASISGRGVDVLVAPQIGDLDSRVASIAMLHGVPLLRVAGLAPKRRAVRSRSRDGGRRGVAVLGTRGVPANYGGFETFAERLSLLLVGWGIPTTVYGRSHYVRQASPWRGVRLVVLPTLRSKYFDTVVHTFFSALHLVLRRGPRDVVLCNAANAPVLLLLRACRRFVVLNVDGLEWRRSKWGVAGRAWYHMGEWLSVRLASVLVTDALEVQTYYRVRHDTDSVMIPYGTDVLERGALPVPELPGVHEGRYVLYVSRWEPENNPVLVARAHARSSTGLTLVMLGQATYDDGIEADVRAAAGPSAVLPGSLFGADYRGLQVNAACYVHATEVGGTHPALIEALGAGNVCLVLDTPENREVAGDVAMFFADEEELAALMAVVEAMPASERRRREIVAREYAAQRYSWEAVGRQYVQLLRSGVAHGS